MQLNPALTPSRGRAVRHSTARLLAACLASSLGFAPAAKAGINASGDVTPDPNTANVTTQLQVGQTGVGSLTVDAGSGLDIGSLFLGTFDTGDGTAIFTGNGTTLEVGDNVTIGSYGRGELQILANADARAYRAIVGSSTGNSGLMIVDGAGSTWTSDYYLTVGANSPGQLHVTNGGIVNAYTSTIWSVTNAGGGITVDGAGSNYYVSDRFYVGSGGDAEATLTISNGGLVQARFVTVDRNSPNASIVFDAGTLETDSLFSSLSQLSGNGVINTHGLASNIDLVFDATHGLNQTFLIDTGGGDLLAVQLEQNAAGSLGVGIGGSSTLTIADGRVVQSSAGSIGLADSGSSSATVDGPGTRWESTGAIQVAGMGQGTLDITNGAQVTSSGGSIAPLADSIGLVNLDGAGSSWSMSGNLSVGSSGDATLSITNGAQVSADRVYVASSDTSSGSILIDGVGSQFTANDPIFQLGSGGTAGLQVTNGGVITSLNVQVGNLNHIATVLLQGAGSAWNNAGFYMPNGDVEIRNGATLSTTKSIGRLNNGVSGSILIDGVGSSWNHTNTFLYIGREGDATINITNGGAMSVSGTNMSLGNEAGNTGTINVVGAGSNLDAYIYLGGSATGTGVLNVLEGASATGSHAWVGYIAGSQGYATVSGPGSSWAVNYLRVGTTAQGTLGVDNDGSIAIAYDLILGGLSHLEFGIGQAGSSLLGVDRDATLDGTLELVVDPGTTLAQGDTFTLIDIGGTQSGVFSNVAEGGLLGTFDGVDLLLTYLGGDGNDVVAFVDGPVFTRGDMNGDDALTNADIAPFVQALTDPEGYASAFPLIDPDLNGDFDASGTITNADIAGFVDALTGGGATLTQEQQAQLSAVPEPTSLVLLSIGGLMLTRHRRRSA